MPWPRPERGCRTRARASTRAQPCWFAIRVSLAICLLAVAQGCNRRWFAGLDVAYHNIQAREREVHGSSARVRLGARPFRPTYFSLSVGASQLGGRHFLLTPSLAMTLDFAELIATLHGDLRPWFLIRAGIVLDLTFSFAPPGTPDWSDYILIRPAAGPHLALGWHASTCADLVLRYDMTLLTVTPAGIIYTGHLVALGLDYYF